MAHYDIFREQLAMKYPGFGYALWVPEPRNPDRPVQVGDVGFIREGKFQRLFNALLPADDPSHEFGVPEYHEPLVPSVLNHIDRSSRSPNNYCSAGVNVGADPDYHPLGPDDFRQVSFHSRTRGAVSSLPAKTLCENTLANGEFGRWMVQHIGSWLAFARKLGLGIEEMEEIVLVTGCDLTSSWTNIAFLGGRAGAQVSYGVKVEGPDINYQLLPELVRGAVINQGPKGTNLPENQCVFVRGFRVARAFWPLPKHLKAAAGPSPDPGGHDCDPDMELVSILPIPKYRDPLHLLQDYIAEQAPDCDMVLAHDSDLLAINGIGHGTSLETLEPDVMMDLLRKSNIKIHKVSCGELPTVKVAMVSATFQNWNTAPPSQLSTLASQNIDLDHTNESRGTPPTIPDNLLVPAIVQSALGELRPTYGGRYSQAAVSPWPHSRMPVGCDAVIDTSQTLQQPPASQSRSTLSELHLAHETSSPDYTRAGPSPCFWRPTFPEPNVPGYGTVDEPGLRALRKSRPAFSPSQDAAGMQNALEVDPPTKKRKALVIGISYSQHPKPRFKLRHGSEDAYSIANLLCDQYGYKRDDIRLMTDDTPWDLPTKENILEAMGTLVHDARPGDSFVYYFSGHSLQIKDDADATGDELNGLDECICAMDYSGDDPNLNPNTPGLIVDDVMRELMVNPLPRQCRLTAIFDSSDGHSHPPLGLPYIYCEQLGIPSILHRTASHGDIVSLSTGNDGEVNETDRGGALRCAFIESVRTFGNTLSYMELLWSIRECMKRDGILQRPQLSTSHEIVSCTVLSA